jgi:hypothetical protein
MIHAAEIERSEGEFPTVGQAKARFENPTP